MSESDLRQEIAQLRAEVNRVDDWANGIFSVLLEVLPPLLRKNPDIAEKLVDSWRGAAERFDVIAPPAEPQVDLSQPESLEFLESRKILYRTLDLLGAWPKPGKS